MNTKSKESTASKTGAVVGKTIASISKFLTMLFCVLRACDVIDWQWYWVVSPTIIAWLFAFVMFAFSGVLMAALAHGED